MRLTEQHRRLAATRRRRAPVEPRRGCARPASSPVPPVSWICRAATVASGCFGAARTRRSAASSATSGWPSLGERLLDGQCVGLTRVAPKRILGERAGALGLVLDQERVERRRAAPYAAVRRRPSPGPRPRRAPRWERVGRGRRRRARGPGRGERRRIGVASENGANAPRGHFLACRVVGAGDREGAASCRSRSCASWFPWQPTSTSRGGGFSEDHRLGQVGRLPANLVTHLTEGALAIDAAERRCGGRAEAVAPVGPR